MFRSPWFWIALVLILLGIALTAALGALYWLITAFVAAILMLVVVFLLAAYRVGEAGQVEVSRLPHVPKPERISVVYDCDLALGRPFRDVSDGLALLYLLGDPRVYVRFVSAAYGNDSVSKAARTTQRLLNSLLYDDVAVLRGASGPDDDPEENRAARYLKNIVSTDPGKIVLVATGAMTNLKHAAALDPDFFGKLRGLYLCGGVTEPLLWNGRQLADLNLAFDPEAAYQAIHAGCPVTIAAGQAGLSAVFRSPQFAALQALNDPVSRLIVRQTRFWFALTRLWFHDDGFAMWSSVATLPLVQPELFEFEQAYITSTVEELAAGQLVVDPSPHGPVRLVRAVRDFEGFIAAHFAAWSRLGRSVSGRKRSRGK